MTRSFGFIWGLAMKKMTASSKTTQAATNTHQSHSSVSAMTRYSGT
jgi:hypothetical protein